MSIDIIAFIYYMPNYVFKYIKMLLTIISINTFDYKDRSDIRRSCANLRQSTNS